MAYFFKGVNFTGPFLYLQSGSAAGRNIVACPNKSYSCEEIAGEIGSFRIEQNTIAMVSDSTSLYSSASRVFVGPIDVPAADFKINSILVRRFRSYDLSAPPPAPLMTICNGSSMLGMHAFINRGVYDRTRMLTEEVKMDPYNILSFKVQSGAIAIIRGSKKEILIVGPYTVNDMNDVGFYSEKIQSIEIIYDDPTAAIVSKQISELHRQPVAAPQIEHINNTTKVYYISQMPEPEGLKVYILPLFIMAIILILLNIIRLKIIHDRGYYFANNTTNSNIRNSEV